MAFLQSVIPHPTDSNKLRLTFSAALNTATVTAANFSLSPAVTVQWAAIVAGSGNTQVDLHFGTDLPTDANTTALWRFNEASGTTAADSGPGGYTLTDQGTAVITDNGLIGRARTLGGVTNSSLQSGFTTGPRTDLLGEWTVDILFRPDATQPDTPGDILSFVGANNTLQAENRLVVVGMNNTGQPYVLWENGAGVAVTAIATFQGVVPNNKMGLLTAIKRATGSGYAVTVLVNGNSVSGGQGNVVSNADGGNSASMRWAVGCRPNATNISRFKGVIDTIRVTNVARTDAQIASYANDLLFPLTRGTTYTVTCTGVQDAGAVAITGDDAVYTVKYFGTNDVSSGGNTSKEVYATGGPLRSFSSGVESSNPAINLTAQRIAGSTIRIESTTALAANAATTVPANWTITGPSTITVSSVSFTPGNSYLDLNVSGTFVTGSYLIDTAAQTVKDIYNQYWSGSIPLGIVAGGAGGGSNFNTGLN